jgi:hypothetical protein
MEKRRVLMGAARTPRCETRWHRLRGSLVIDDGSDCSPSRVANRSIERSHRAISSADHGVHLQKRGVNSQDA